MADATIVDGRHTYRVQTLGRVFGWFFLATFLTLDPGVLHRLRRRCWITPSLITGAGADPTTGIATGAALETLLIVANVATAVVLSTRSSSGERDGAIGYVSARLVEAMFIAIGIVSAPRVPAHAAGRHGGRTPALGDAFDSHLRSSVPRWAWLLRWRLANGVILGYLMYRSELVPRGMTWLGLIGGPLS